LTHSAAPSTAFGGGVKKRRSGSTLSKPQHLCWGVEGLILKKVESEFLPIINERILLIKEIRYAIPELVEGLTPFFSF